MQGGGVQGKSCDDDEDSYWAAFDLTPATFAILDLAGLYLFIIKSLWEVSLSLSSCQCQLVALACG